MEAKPRFNFWRVAGKYLLTFVAVVAVLWGLVVALVLFGEREYQKRGPYTPEQKAFLTWAEQFDDKVGVDWEDAPDRCRRPIRSIRFQGWSDRNFVENDGLRISDEDVKTYLVNLPVTYVELTNVDISVRGVAALLDNPDLKTVIYAYYRLDKGIEIEKRFDVEERRTFLQQEFLSLADDPEDDFLSLFYPENKLANRRSSENESNPDTIRDVEINVGQ